MRNVVFAQHNLAMDRSFNEFNVIVCRNVMIYFERSLQERVFELFDDSLARLGVLALGHKESLADEPARRSLQGARPARAPLPQGQMTYELVVIGASWGGLRAVGTVLEGLGDAPGAAIVVGQHRGPTGGERLAPLLQRNTRLPVREAEDKDRLTPGTVYLAPRITTR